MFYELIHVSIINQAIDRIKVVLVEKNKTNKWLAEQLGKDPVTISNWCTNKVQPSLETLMEISKVLNVDVKELIRSSIETTNKNEA